MKLTIFFDEGCKFWVGVIELEESGRLKACRHIFGNDPKDAEILEFVKKQMIALIACSRQTVERQPRKEYRMNPKRLARLASKELDRKGVSTFAQDAIKLELESRKQERKELHRQRKEEFAERKYRLKVQKAKLKHKGR